MTVSSLAEGASVCRLAALFAPGKDRLSEAQRPTT